MELQADNYLTVKEVADRLRCGTKKAYQLVNQPDFPKIKIGKSILIPESELEKFLHRYIGKTYVID